MEIKEKNVELVNLSVVSPAGDVEVVECVDS